MVQGAGKMGRWKIVLLDSSICAHLKFYWLQCITSKENLELEVNKTISKTCRDILHKINHCIMPEPVNKNSEKEILAGEE